MHTSPFPYIDLDNQSSDVRDVCDDCEVLDTGAVQRLTGLTRSAIYFYIRQGLLPAPQRTATGRLLFGPEHLELLREISALKAQGLGISEIRKSLSRRARQVAKSTVDLAARERERTRAAIISLATEEFMAKGYKRTHVSTIIQKLGITPQVFYGHFPSKLQLLAECFRSFIEQGSSSIEPGIARYADPVERAVRRLATDRRGDELGSMLAAAIRSEGKLDPEDQAAVSEAMQTVMRRFASELQRERPAELGSLPVSEELLVYGLVGALSFQSMRASWGLGLTFADFLRANIFIYLCVLAGLRGEADILARLSRYEDLIQEAAAAQETKPE